MLDSSTNLDLTSIAAECYAGVCLRNYSATGWRIVEVEELHMLALIGFANLVFGSADAREWAEYRNYGVGVLGHFALESNRPRIFWLITGNHAAPNRHFIAFPREASQVSELLETKLNGWTSGTTSENHGKDNE